MSLSKLKSFSSKGFTLIELLIVIAILGVLAAAILIAINPAQRIASARNARVKSDLSSIGNSAILFNTDTGINAGCTASYPSGFGAAANGCTAGITFMASIYDPSGTVYDFEALPASCTTTTPCTSVSVAGPAYVDGVVTTAGVWCWRSTTGTIEYAAADANCP